MKAELAYQQGRSEQILEIQDFIDSSIRKHGKTSVLAIVESHNDLIQYLHMEISRINNNRFSLLASALEDQGVII